jgi:hypothetical protein
MAGWRGTGGTVMRRFGVLVAAAALLVGVAGVPAQAAVATHRGAPSLPKVKAATGVGKLGVTPRKKPLAVRSYRARETRWPTAATASIALDISPAPLSPAGKAATQRTLVTQGLVVRGPGTE